MNKILEFETYLSISQTKFGIYLFDTKNKNNLYEKEIIFEKINFINYSHLKQFLDDNVFRIEKLVGKFIENIFLIDFFLFYHAHLFKIKIVRLHHCRSLRS